LEQADHHLYTSANQAAVAMALEPLLIARPAPGGDTPGAVDGALLPALANRHGLIAGATGTGKTVTLQRIVEQVSRIGVPTLLADVKGDLSGLAAAGQEKAAFSERREQLGLPRAAFAPCPVEFWDVLGEQGHPLRATISELGPILLARLLNLNDTQAGVLTIAFRLADDQGLLLLDLKDLQELLRHLSEKARDYQNIYGNISAASVGAIQRALLALEQQSADRFFGEPSLNLMDLLQTDGAGHGVVNILAADQLVLSPKLYATVMLWLLSQLYEQLPEVGDAEKPKLLVIFDEAHLLFDGAPPVLLEKVEQVVRLIRSKGVGLYFCTQNPLDLPPKVLGQLSNRVQHALRAFTPQEQKAVKAAATTFRPNPPLDVEAAIGELAVGEALVSFLDGNGAPTPVERALVVPPESRVGTITAEERQALRQASPLHAHYREAQDRESAYELLRRRAADAAAAVEAAKREAEAAMREAKAAKQADALAKQEASEQQRRERAEQRAEEREAARAAATAARGKERLLLSLAGEAGNLFGGRTGRSIARGLMGGILGRRS
jgi:DNA helicase HerA-like ATPase